MSLICKTKEDDSFPCPLIEKVSFPLIISHCENSAWRSKGIPVSTLKCIDNYQA